MSFDLWLVVQGEAGETRDLAVRVGSQTTVGELAASLAKVVWASSSSRAGWSLYSHLRGTWLREHDLVASEGLRHGEIVAVAPGGSAGRQGSAAISGGNSVVSLRLVAGPEVGAEVRLSAGEYTIGRAAGSAIQVEDPFVAAAHARLSVGGDRLLLTDLGSGTGTLVDRQVVTGSLAVRPGQLISIGGSTLEITSHRQGSEERSGEGAEILFNRPPRVMVPAARVLHQLEAPPSEIGPTRLPIAAALLPLLLGGVMLFFYRNPLTLIFLALSPVLAIGSYLEGWLGGRGEHRRAVAKFRSRVADLRRDLGVAIHDEIERRRDEAPDLRRLALAAHRRESWLWERRLQDDDFMQLRVAITTSLSRHRFAMREGGAAALRDEASAALDPLALVEGVPLILSVAEKGTVGLAGSRGAVLRIARWLTVQAAVLHSPRDLSICAALPRADAAEWDWLKWLPHTRESVRQFEGLGLCVDNRSSRDLVDNLVALVDARSAEMGPFRGTSSRAPYPYVLVLLHEDLPLARGTLTRLLAEGPRVGILTLWLGRAVRDLPNECRAIVEVDQTSKVTLTFPAEGEVQVGRGTRDSATSAEARQVALELAPLRDTAAGDARSELPRQVALLDLLGLSPVPTAGEVATRWSNGEGGLAAPLGVSAGRPWSVDLRRDGPHCLVGGTTGAGKSELLQSLVASLAASQPPSRLNFLLVDYKGGSAFKDAARLPHTVGLVTDLDGHLANRALVSLRAELKRRERILRESSVRDMAELERRSLSACPASLVIVVDEFATLAKEVPDFVDGVVDLAQRGRSLGLHLVLATQRPAGVVNDNIRANTNLRIALRVSDESESTDIIGVPDAARIPRTTPGRAFARTGHQELVEFQSAFVGGTRANDRTPAAVEVVDLGLSGPVWGTLNDRPPADCEDTDLQRLVAAIDAAHAELGGGAAPRPWLPELLQVLPASALAEQVHAAEPGVALGLVDMPESQRQEPWVWNQHQDGNLLVLGTTGSGKTSLLRSIAHAMAIKYEPGALHLYAVDCAGGGLAAVQKLPHCGACLLADESERIARLVQFLRALIDRRRASIVRSGATFQDGGEPLVVVLLDNYSGFVSAMEKVDFGEHVDALPRLIADGPSVGVHFAITADRRGAVPGAVSAIVGARIVLRMVDEDEYRNAGIAREAFRGARLPPGRGFLGNGLEVQCAVLGDSGEPDQQAHVLAATGMALKRRFGEVLIPALRLLPSRVEMSELNQPSAQFRAVIGLADADSGSAEMDLSEDGQLVAGPPHSGRSNALLIAVCSLRQSTPGARFVLLAPRRSPLLDLHLFDEVARGSTECGKLAARLEEMGRAAEMDADPGLTVVVVDDGEEIAEGPTAVRLESVARQGRDRSVRIIGAVETRTAHRAYAGWVSELRKTRQGLLLQPDPDIDGDLLGVRLPRRGSRVFPPGRAFLVRRGVLELVQVAVPTTT